MPTDSLTSFITHFIQHAHWITYLIGSLSISLFSQHADWITCFIHTSPKKIFKSCYMCYIIWIDSKPWTSEGHVESPHTWDSSVLCVPLKDGEEDCMAAAPVTAATIGSEFDALCSASQWEWSCSGEGRLAIQLGQMKPCKQKYSNTSKTFSYSTLTYLESPVITLCCWHTGSYRQFNTLGMGWKLQNTVIRHWSVLKWWTIIKSSSASNDDIKLLTSPLITKFQAFNPIFRFNKLVYTVGCLCIFSSKAGASVARELLSSVTNSRKAHLF